MSFLETNPLYLNKEQNIEYRLNKLSDDQIRSSNLFSNDLTKLASEIKHIVQLIAEIRLSNDKKDEHYINLLEKFSTRLTDEHNRNTSLELSIQKISNSYAQKFATIVVLLACCGTGFKYFIQPQLDLIHNELVKHDDQIKSLVIKTIQYEK